VRWIFLLKFSTEMLIRTMNGTLKKYLGENYHIHQLRHSCFTNLLESGTDLRLIQKIAGHTNVKTTEIYTHVSNQMLSKVKLPI
jgi:integrase/recombinase XerD